MSLHLWLMMLNEKKASDFQAGAMGSNSSASVEMCEVEIGEGNSSLNFSSSEDLEGVFVDCYLEGSRPLLYFFIY